MRDLLNSEFFMLHKEAILKGGVIGLIVLTAMIVFLFHTGGNDEVQLQEEPAVSAEEQLQEGEAQRPEESNTVVIVDVSGAVVTPSVVKLDEGARVEDAITAAGGLSENADVSSINRAALLHDGEKIYIPAVGEEPSSVQQESVSGGTAGSSDGTSSGGGLININTATAEQLQALKGVGPATADKIIEYRTLYGGFESIEDIMKVNGIGEKTFEGLKDQITV